MHPPDLSHAPCKDSINYAFQGRCLTCMSLLPDKLDNLNACFCSNRWVPQALVSLATSTASYSLWAPIALTTLTTLPPYAP